MDWNWDTNITKDALVDLYVRKKLGMRAIAEIFRVRRETIRRHLKRYEIPVDASIRKWSSTSKLKPTRLQLEFMYGTIMGDSGVYRTNKGAISTRMAFSHCAEQFDYILWKRAILGRLCASRKVKVYVSRDGNRTCINTATYSCHFFRGLRDVFYDPNGRKRVTQSILDRMTDFSVAVWYMDDGCRKKLGMELATCHFNIEEHELMRKWFMMKWGIRPIIRKFQTGHTLFFNKVNSWRLSELLRKYVIPSMKYKIDVPIDPQRLHEGLLREEKMIQSELHGDMQSATETSAPA